MKYWINIFILIFSSISFSQQTSTISQIDIVADYWNQEYKSAQTIDLIMLAKSARLNVEIKDTSNFHNIDSLIKTSKLSKRKPSSFDIKIVCVIHRMGKISDTLGFAFSDYFLLNNKYYLMNNRLFDILTIYLPNDYRSTIETK